MKDKSNKTKNSNKLKSIESKSIDMSIEKTNLQKQISKLKKEVHRFKIERDIYEKAAEIIKKDKGINIKFLID